MDFLSPARQLRQWSHLFGLAVIGSVLAAIKFEMYFLAGIPLVIVLGYLAVVDYKKLFFLLWFCIPLSTEVVFPNGFGTDLPTEPLILLLMGVYFLHLVLNGKQLKSHFLLHPISLILLLHIGWIAATMVTSGLPFFSIKFLLAKIWYVATFYFLAGWLMREERDIKTFFWCVFIPLITTVLIVLVRHSSLDFAFADVNKVVAPFYRNHVNYACLMALFFPIVWLARGWYPKWSGKWWALIFGIAVLLVGIYFSYTRAAYAAILLALGAYYVVKMRAMKIVAGLSLAALVLLLALLYQKNQYLELAPNFEKTITHESFDNLLEATYKGEDISTMERVYRWMAGFQMSNERRWMGFGPGNFYNFYKSYTITSFRTYVSDNPERSGIHSYYLMTLVEQGLPGLLIFLFLTFYVLIRGERIYHQTHDPARRRIVLMALLCMVVIDTLLLINDMVETDKVGSFFFLCLAILVNWDLKNYRESEFLSEPEK